MLPNFHDLLEQYARVVINVGVNLQPGQRLLIRKAPLEAAPFVRAVAKVAYQTGARFVEVLWDDEQIHLLRCRYAPRDSYAELPYGFLHGGNRSAEELDPAIGITEGTPGLLAGEDERFVHASAASQGEATRYFRDSVFRNDFPWCFVSAATPGWADRVFPEIEPALRQDHLWDAIFCATRSDQPDPVGSWEVHLAELGRRSVYLNAKGYAALHYHGPDTDLRVGLPRGHVWESAHLRTGAGIPFLCNVPSEEVFTLPHREQVDGYVSSTMPFSYDGVLIRDMKLRFEHGRVIEASASAGGDALNNLLRSDEDSNRPGEVALVPHSSIMSRWQRLFYITLYDENAASHIALGAAYRTSLRGGKEMSGEEFAAAGGNDSVIHVDFMVGSAHMNVDGITADGRAEPLMRAGEWAFDAPGYSTGM